MSKNTEIGDGSEAIEIYRRKAVTEEEARSRQRTRRKTAAIVNRRIERDWSGWLRFGFRRAME